MALPIEDPQDISTADADRMESRSPSTRGFETRATTDLVERPLSVLVDLICRHFSVSSSELERGARNDRATRARAVLAFVLVVRRRLPISEVAAPLGVSPQAIGRAIERGAQLARQEEPYPRGWS